MLINPSTDERFEPTRSAQVEAFPSDGKLTPAGIGNPLYYRVFEQARLAMVEAITVALAPDYKVADDLNVLFDPNEDSGPVPIGARFTEDNLVIIDPRKREIVAGVRFYAVGHALITSADSGFDAYEGKLDAELGALASLYDDRLDETFKNGRLIFKSVEDQAMGVEQFAQTRPAIFATADVRSSDYTGLKFHYPSGLEVEGADIAIEMIEYRKPGSYLLRKRAGEPQQSQRFDLPQDLHIEHAQLYYVEPIHLEWMKQLIACELEIFGGESQLGSVSRDWDIQLSREDVDDLAAQMAGLPYPSRGQTFIRLEDLLYKHPGLKVDKQLLELSAGTEWKVWDAFGKDLGIDPRKWEGMEELRSKQYDDAHSKAFARLERLAEEEFWEKAEKLLPPPEGKN